MSAAAEERTEPATAEKLRRARREGQVAKSRDLVGSAALAAGLFTLTASLSALPARWSAWLRELDVAHPRPDAIAAALTEGLELLAAVVAPVATAACAAAVAASLLQAGFLFAPKTVAPRFDRVSPRAGAQRLFSADKLFELAKNVAKIIVAGIAAAWLTHERLRELALLGRAPTAEGVEVALELARSYAAVLSVSFLLIGVADATWSRLSFARRMRMSKREVRREQLQAEGDPRRKSARRELARELLMTGRVADVKRAAVVVVNPVHFAVALAYRPGPAARGAPTVLAKGRSAGAKALRRAARRWGVPVVENPPLARALHELALGDEIPEELWDAVADVLALLFGAPSIDVGPPTPSDG